MVTIVNEIGYVENYIGGDRIVLWFYRRNLGLWRIAHRQVVTVSQRETKLRELMGKCRLIELGRGS